MLLFDCFCFSIISFYCTIIIIEPPFSSRTRRFSPPSLIFFTPKRIGEDYAPGRIWVSEKVKFRIVAIFQVDRRCYISIKITFDKYVGDWASCVVIFHRVCASEKSENTMCLVHFDLHTWHWQHTLHSKTYTYKRIIYLSSKLRLSCFIWMHINHRRYTALENISNWHIAFVCASPLLGWTPNAWEAPNRLISK